MKKLNLMLAGIVMLAATTISCSSEEKTVQQQENAKTTEFAKTTEMLNFESSLKEYLQAKRENADTTAKTEASTKISQDASALLKSIGATVNTAEGKSPQTTDELVRIAMRAYSKKLTEMYRAQNN